MTILLRFGSGQKIYTPLPECTGTRTAAAVESRPQRGCCNRRLSCLLGELAKIYFQTYSRNKHESLRSKQQPIVDKSAETPPAERVPLVAQKNATPSKKTVAFVRIKGLEPPRLSASDPKSDVATNYTISAGFGCKGRYYFGICKLFSNFV